MNGWIFPGQPLQYEPLLPDDDDFRIINLKCRERCGYDLENKQPLSAGSLSQHTCLQIYGVAMSLYRARRLLFKGEKPELIAEHSLGIYAALNAAGCITEGDALELAARLGACMRVMSATKEYALGCPIGLSVGAVESAARNNRVFVANYNTSSHFLLAGESEGIESALAECREAGAFNASSFSCEAPLHTPLMAVIASQLEAVVSDYNFAEPVVPVIEHISQTRLKASDIPTFLLDELLKPVWWERSYLTLLSRGVKNLVEVGSGNALKKFNRWIDSENSQR